MGILMMIKYDIRKRKSQAAVIFLLSFLITLLISTSVSVLWQSQEQYDEAAARMHLPEVINIFNKGQHSDADEVTKNLQKQPETEEVMKENILLLRENQIVRFKDDSWFSNWGFLTLLAIQKGSFWVRKSCRRRFYLEPEEWPDILGHFLPYLLWEKLQWKVQGFYGTEGYAWNRSYFQFWRLPFLLY